MEAPHLGVMVWTKTKTTTLILQRSFHLWLQEGNTFLFD